MYITDEELLMLEHLTYLNNEVAVKAGVEKFKNVNANDFEGKSVYEILQNFDGTAIANLEALGDTEIDGACASGKEWAQIISYLKNDERINHLILTETMETSEGTPLALCFTDGSSDTQEAIVAFKGTTGGDEWKDNVIAATVKETEDQIEALNFIQGLSYTDITLTGHSKGANKINYITILCDKVSRCVGFDPQGFSKLFIENFEYSKLIDERAHLITNYSLSTDFVHILLYEIPGVEHVFCKGFGVDNVKQNHSPNSFFCTDEYGNLILGGNYNPMFVEESESEAAALLRGCVQYLLETGDEDEIQDIVEYVSELMYNFGAGEDMLEYALSDFDRLSVVLGGILSYVDQNDINKDEIEIITDYFGVGFIKELAIEICIEQATDSDNKDSIFTTVAWPLISWRTDLDDYINMDEFKELWQLTAEKYKEYNKKNNKESSPITDALDFIIQENFNIIYGTSSDDVLPGTELNDMIVALEGIDNVSAGSGNDLVFGGGDKDIIYGESGNDKLYGGEGNDELYGGIGDDKLYGEDGEDIIEGYMNDDYIEGGAAKDIISGGFGNDWIYGGIRDVNSADNFSDNSILSGNDEINGNEGNDTIYGGDGNDTINGGIDLTYADESKPTSTDEIIIGDRIWGEDGIDTIHGDIGNDYIDGGNDNDFLYGDDGNDIILGQDGDDTIEGGAGFDFISGGDGIDIIKGEGGMDKIWGDDGNDELHGGAGKDELFGGEGNDTIYGNEGDDYLEGGNGNNHMYGGYNNDTLFGGEELDYMYGQEGNDTFYGGNGGNYMYGGNGDDNFTGGEDYDYIEGGTGHDVMNGGNGYNRMFGQDGVDYIYGGNDNDDIDGGADGDVLMSGNGNNTIHGREGDDDITDGDHTSYIYGGEGDDTVHAGGGNDVIDGGIGDDYIQDDHGNDTIIFKAGYGTDTISDAGGYNTIQLSGLDTSDATFIRSGNDLTVSFGSDAIILKQYYDFYNFNINGTDVSDLIETLYGTDSDDWMSSINSNDNTLYGEGGTDNISGSSGNDTLYGGVGDDSLYGNDGNDILDGGENTDYLCGGNGNDTYIFGKGYGNDSIDDWGGSSTVSFKDLNADDITVSQQYDANLIISVNGTSDVLTINGYKWNQGGYTFEFADGTTGTVNKETWELELDSDTPAEGGTSDSGTENNNNNTDNSGTGDVTTGDTTTDSPDTGDSSTGDTTGEITQPDVNVTDGYVVNGTENNDGWLSAPNNNDGVIDGGNGDDSLNGGSGNDKLYGGAGYDKLYGNDGDDVLDGGIGSDELNGGNGTDTYIFAKGYGNDIINEWSNDVSVIKFTDINSDEVTLNNQSETNLILSVNGTSDSLTISNYRWSQGSLNMEFADGTVGTVNKETWEMEYSQSPAATADYDISEIASEEELVQSNADLLAEIYTEDTAVSEELVAETDETVISDVANATTVSEETDEVSAQTDVQVMILTENMSAFANENNVSDSTNIIDSAMDASALNQLLVDTSVQ